jgi:hypothetical protein
VAETTNKDLLKQVKEFIKGVGYKPGSFFMCGENACCKEHTGVQIKIGLPVNDAYDKAFHARTVIGRNILLTWGEIRSHLPDLDGYLADVIRRALHEGEEHECDEWLTIKGIRLFDPHKPKEKTNGGTDYGRNANV